MKNLKLQLAIDYVREAKDLFKQKKYKATKKVVQLGLQKFPLNIDLLITAISAYNLSGEYKESLRYAKLLISNYPNIQAGHAVAAKCLIKLKRLKEAQKQAIEGLRKFPSQFDLLIIASKSYQLDNKYKESLVCKTLIDNHPTNGKGMIAARDLLKLKQLKEAEQAIEFGLKRLPDQFNLLIFACNFYNLLCEYEKPLEHAMSLVKSHPGRWEGYTLAAKYLINLKRFGKANQLIEAGLLKFPTQFNLLLAASDAYALSNDYEKVIKHSRLMMAFHPGRLEGYLRAAKDSMTLKRIKEAKQRVEAGLEKLPHHLTLLTMGSTVCNSSGDYEGGLMYSELIIAHYPEEWSGYDYIKISNSTT